MIQIIVRIVPNGDKRRAFDQAGAEVSNVSQVEAIADYTVSAGENQNPVTGALDWTSRGHVLRHDRRQSIWALVAKVADWAAEEAEKAQ